MMRETISLVRLLAADDAGQGLVEYALIIALIALAAVGALTLLGNNTNSNLYSHIGNAMSGI